ncbi:hypothetical protein [Nostoc sp. 'Peltigera membranacea cyanobiont' 232]|uniref:hypothetical protein n=1 Tax=Nostoc sp. 'Peltigera membranacea cyanobiont' 232 TaxID=2014531 RepID=UPI0021D52068|nr:hypothetical protein [Nostoc sp. 'Peltigera membranacea cyanobiont' 232]
MMLSPNDQEEARLVRGRQSQSKHISDSDFNRESGSSSYSAGNESLRVDRDYGSSRTVSTSRRKGTPGKIVRRLIGEYRDQVATKKHEIQQLESNIQEFESLLKELEKPEEPE